MHSKNRTAHTKAGPIQKHSKVPKSSPKRSPRHSTPRKTAKRSFSTHDPLRDLQKSFSLLTDIQTSQQQLISQLITSQQQQQDQLRELLQQVGASQAQSGQTPIHLPNAYTPGDGTGPEKNGQPPSGFVTQSLKYAPLYITPPDQRLNEVLSRLAVQVTDLQAELTGLIRTLHPQKAGAGWTPPAKKSAWTPKTAASPTSSATAEITSAAQNVPTGTTSVEAAADRAQQFTHTTAPRKPAEKKEKSDSYIVRPDPHAVPELQFAIPQADV